MIQNVHGFLELAAVIDSQNLLEIEGAGANCKPILNQISIVSVR